MQIKTQKALDKQHNAVYNTQAVENAAIAQPVERILGKDEVASSNLASSSKPLNLLEVQGFFLFLPKSHDLILHIKILIRDEVISKFHKS